MSAFASEDLRQIALLLGALEDREYAAIAARLPANLRDALQNASVNLEDVDAHERDRVIQQFLQGYQRRIGQRPAASEMHKTLPAINTLEHHSFTSLIAQTPPEEMRPLVAAESAQTLAVVVAQLPPERAAEVLKHLPTSRRSEVLNRVLELDETDPESLAHVQAVLARKMKAAIRQHFTHSDRRHRVDAILQATDPDGGVAEPTDSEPKTTPLPQEGLIHDAASTSVQFDGLVDCSEFQLARVFGTVPARVAVVALAGASQLARQNILARLPAELAALLRDGISKAGALRLSDIQLSQAVVLRMMQQDVEEGPPPATRSHGITISA